jgi:hypothetical protein
MSIDGSKIINNTITNQQISNGTINDLQIAGNADIQQSKILNLTGDLTNVNTNITTLQNYFFNSRLKLANLTKSTNNYQVLSQDGSANDPAYRQLDSNYITSLDQSKINQNNNNQYIKYCDSINFNNITTFINSLPSAYTAIIYPFNNIGGNYSITNNDTWLAINCSIQGLYKSVNASNVNIDSFANSNTLNLGNASNVYGQYMNNINFNCIVNIKVFLNAYFENMNFAKATNLTVAANSFVIFINCTFSAPFNVVSIGTGGLVFMNSCNFTSKTWTSTSNSGSVLIANCSNLPTLSSLPTGFFLANVNGTQTETQINVSKPAFYSSLSNTKYLYTSSDIAPAANILGTQLSNSAGLVNSQITSLSYSKLTSVPTSFASSTSTLTVDSGINMGTNLITSTATNTEIGSSSTNLITKNYADANYSSAVNILPLNNTWTGTNNFTNSTFILDSTVSNNPISRQEFMKNNIFTYDIPYYNNLSFWYDFSDVTTSIQWLSGTSTYVSNVNNKQPSSYSYPLYNLRSTINLRPRLDLYSIGIPSISFNPDNYQMFILNVNSNNFSNSSLMMYTNFIVFRPNASTGDAQTLITGDYATSQTKLNVKITNLSGRNNWSSSNFSLGVNVGTVGGLFSNGWYKLTRNGQQSGEITLPSMLGKTHIICFDNVIFQNIFLNNQRSSYVQNAWVTCPTNTLPFDTKCMNNISSQYQDSSGQGYLSIGASSSDNFVNAETTQLYDGWIGEILMFNNKLDDTQRQHVTSYLQAKWNVF